MFDEDGVAGDVDGVISDAFEGAEDEDKMEVGFDIGGGLLHSFGKLFSELAFDGIKFAIAFLEGEGEFRIAFGEGFYGISEDAGGHIVDGFDEFGFVEFHVFQDFAGAAPDIAGLIGDSLEVFRNAHGGEHDTEVMCDGLVSHDELESFGIDFLFEDVDIFVVGDGLVTELEIAFEETFHPIGEIALRDGGHGEDFLATIQETGFEVTENMTHKEKVKWGPL